MIIREWRARAVPDKSELYPRHFHERVVPHLQRIPGFLGAQLNRREIGERIEFLVITKWQSMAAIRSFAGAQIDRAVVEPGAVAALADFNDTVSYYAVVEEVAGAPAAARHGRGG